MRKQFLSVMLLCGALLVGCSSQGNSIQDQVESLTEETQAFITEAERVEEFEYTVGILNDVKFFSYEENVIIMSSHCAKRTSFTKEEDIKFGYDVSTPVMNYNFNRELLSIHNLQDVKLIMEVKTYQDEVIGYYDGTTWEQAK